MSGQPLGRSEAIDYWERRHGAQGQLGAGGDIGLSDEGNRSFYAVRTGILLSLLAEISLGDRTAPLRVLDAGCGQGFFARSLADCGYRVVGIDASPTAIEAASEAGGGPSYAVAALDRYWDDDLFDVVVAIDVLFHVTDEQTFVDSVERLAAHVSAGGSLIITDRDEPRRLAQSDYIIHRPTSEYEALLTPRGFRHTAFRSYAFPRNPIGFHVYRKDLHDANR